MKTARRRQAAVSVPSSARMPRDAENIQAIENPEGLDIVIYTYDRGGEPHAVAFVGKAGKPRWHHRFRSEGQRSKHIKNTVEERKRHFEEKELRKKEREEFKHGFQVGDILESSWGYDQTNVDFYEVLASREKTITIAEIAKKVARSARGADYVVPVPGRVVGKKMTKRPSSGGWVKISSYAAAKKWDGKPKYQTAVGWGH